MPMYRPHTEEARKKIREALIGNTYASVNKGEKNHCHKLTDEDVFMIMKSPLSTRRLAKILGVSQGAVQHVRTGITWSHITKIDRRN